MPGQRDEFTAYRLLYFILARSRSDMANMLATLTERDRRVPAIGHALQVRQAVSQGDYRRLFRLAVVAPNMGGYLMDHFLPRERTLALLAMCKAYACTHRAARAGRRAMGMLIDGASVLPIAARAATV